MRVLVLRGVDGAGGGADEIILRSAQSIDNNRIDMRLCFFRHIQDELFTFEKRSRELGLDYCEIRHRGRFDLSAFLKLRRIISDFRPDIVHSHDYKASFFSRVVTRKRHVRTVATSHGWTGSGFVEKNVYYPGDRRVLRSFDHVIAVSDDIRKTLIRGGVSPNRISVLLNGISKDFVASPRTRESVRRDFDLLEGDFVLGAVGRIEHQKRFDLMLVAFQQVLQPIPHAKLLIIGEGSLRSSIQAQIAQMGLSGSCRMLGHCDDMPKVYKAFDMLVQSSDYEGTPTVIVEAMALGIPVVATNAGGTAQLAIPNEHALIVPCGDMNGLARAVVRAHQEPDETQRRVVAARTRAETELTFERRTEKLTRLYESLSAT